MKRTLKIELTPEEVKMAIVEFARNKYYEKNEYSSDGGFDEASANGVSFDVKASNSNARYEADELIISAKVEVSHEFDTSSS